MTCVGVDKQKQVAPHPQPGGRTLSTLSDPETRAINTLYSWLDLCFPKWPYLTRSLKKKNTNIRRSYGLNCVPCQNSYVEVLVPNSWKVTVSGHRAFKEVVQVKWGHWDDTA